MRESEAQKRFGKLRQAWSRRAHIGDSLQELGHNMVHKWYTKLLLSGFKGRFDL